ncbi:hypothetical protein BFJ63_vAg16090 [Fusarium oxysporum f. sp. narcissi]|uniref:Uncharacterized protein n=1 Tax=Fusarium oxysporum f. sp. narcissi TaxID=451672 RepID=A0A4Q2V2Y9_FUSOX|nr:hypothetical protein BFJ63_vAg16090 [Fusarium oxysporum f. sp. narcissi]
MSLPLTTESSTVMSDLNTQTTVQNERGQGAPHTTGHSKVHRTGPEPGQFTHKTHAKDGGKASIVPQKLQEKLPESVERAVPNAIHNTGNAGGLHRKQ